MKVLHVYRTYFPDTVGGLQEAIRQIALATNTEGVENTIFALSPRGYDIQFAPEGRIVNESSIASVFSCDIGSWKSLQTFIRLAKDVDLVHLHYPWPFGDIMALCLPRKTPVVVTYHSDILRQKLLMAMYAPFRSILASRVKRWIATSPNYAESSTFLNRALIKPKVSVIPLSTDEPSVLPLEGVDWRNKIGFDSNQPFVLFVGEFRYYKGLEYLINAAPLVGGNIVLAGKTSPNLLGLTQSHKNIFVLGEVTREERECLLQKAFALILPSHLRTEAFGVVLLEAGCRGLPMITCEIKTGTSFVNIHGKTGLVVPPRDPEALAMAINRLLTNPSERLQFSKAARQRYLELFTPKLIGRKYCDLYDKSV